MFRRMIESVGRIFDSGNHLRVREGRRRASRRFSPSLAVEDLEMRLSLSGIPGNTVTVTNEEPPVPPAIAEAPPDQMTSPTDEEFIYDPAVALAPLIQMTNAELTMNDPPVALAPLVQVTNEELTANDPAVALAPLVPMTTEELTANDPAVALAPMPW